MDATLFSRFLTALEVPHTEWFSSRQFRSMTFKSVFGLTKLLQSYGIPSETLRFSDKAAALEELPVPFLAQLDGCFAVVTGKDSAGITYSTPDAPPGSRMSTGDFLKSWTGVALIAYPDASSAEPQLASHRLTSFVSRMVPWTAVVAALVLIAGLGIRGGTLLSWGSAALLALNLFGMYVSTLLVQKSSGFHTAAADRVCSIIERTGCNTVLSTEAAKFLGVISWSAVGLAYFSVNVLALLLAPGSIGAIALLNICCLPFSFWSVWYQHFRAGAWCTMCLLVQATLWAIFIVNLTAGLIVWPPVRMDIILLAAGYVLATLLVNVISGAFARLHTKS